MNIKKLVSQLPVQIIIMIAFVVLFGDKLPLQLQQLFFGLSVCIKEILIYLLPLVIFALIFNSMIQMTHGALKVIAFLFLALCTSNYLVSWYGYLVSYLFLDNINLAIEATDKAHQLQPMFSLDIGVIIKNEYALIAGILSGVFFVYKYQALGDKLATKLSCYANCFLNKIFVPLVPIFILGIMIQLRHDGVLVDIIKHYSAIIGLIVCCQVVYTLLSYYLVSGFDYKETVSNFKNMLPAGITGICTMSSAASLPAALEGSKKNTKDPKLTELVLSAAININLIGDGVVTIVVVNAVLVSFGLDIMTVQQFFAFSIMYTLLRFAGAAVPGGGILVIMPMLETRYGFNGEMIAIVYAIYVLCDAFSACINVMNNGAFTVAFKKIFGNKIAFKPEEELAV